MGNAGDQRDGRPEGLPSQPSDEEAGVRLYRYRQARRAGLIPEDALEFAESDADIGELRKLVAAGCPPETLARIVL